MSRSFTDFHASIALQLPSKMSFNRTRYGMAPWPGSRGSDIVLPPGRGAMPWRAG